MRVAPPAPWIDKSAHGKPIVAMFICYTGRPEEGERLVAPIKAFGKPVGDIVQRRSYVSQQSLLDATQPKGRRYYWKSEYMPRVGDDIYASAQQHARGIVSPHSAVILFPMGGAIGKHPTDHSAVGNRDAKWVFNIAASWEKPEDDVANIEWARSTWRDMKKYSTGGTYINFLTEEEGSERIEARVRRELRASCQGESRLGSAEHVPGQQERGAGGVMAMIKLTFHGHSCWEVQGSKHRILIDPFLTGNPVADAKPADFSKLDAILISHGHGDHIGDAEAIAKKSGALVVSNFEIANYFSARGCTTHGMSIGGGFNFDFGRVKLVIAHHGSTGPGGEALGSPAGIVLTLDGKRIYHTGDTGVFLDMQLIAELNGPLRHLHASDR